MNGLYITTTELRTRSAELINLLAAGSDINLVHRSRIIGEIIPSKPAAKPLTAADITKLKKIAKKLNLPQLSYKQRDKLYRAHLMGKYG